MTEKTHGNISQKGSSMLSGYLYGPNNELLTYERYGFLAASKSTGDLTALKATLIVVTNDYLKKTEEDKSNIISALENRISSAKNTLAEKEAEYNTLQHKKENKKSEIDEIKEKIGRAKKNPQEVLKESVNKFSVYIGTILLILMSVYLVLFYSSAAYSAFFKEFSITDTTISQAIFDGQAFAKALNDGFSELLIIVLFPSVFLGVAFLIHVGDNKKGIPDWLVYTFAFLFDALLAFEISKKIYDLKRLGDFASNLPPYSIKLALQSADFWIIIFAGFMVYIIWGLIFGQVADGWRKMKHISIHIADLKEKLSDLEKDMTEIISKFNEKEAEIKKLKTEIEHNLKKIETIKVKTLIDVNTFKEVINDTFKGWVNWMSHMDHNKDRREEAENIKDQFVENFLKGVSTEKFFILN